MADDGRGKCLERRVGPAMRRPVIGVNDRITSASSLRRAERTSGGPWNGTRSSPCPGRRVNDIWDNRKQRALEATCVMRVVYTTS